MLAGRTKTCIAAIQALGWFNVIHTAACDFSLSAPSYYFWPRFCCHSFTMRVMGLLLQLVAQDLGAWSDGADGGDLLLCCQGWWGGGNGLLGLYEWRHPGWTLSGSHTKEAKPWILELAGNIACHHMCLLPRVFRMFGGFPTRSRSLEFARESMNSAGKSKHLQWIFLHVGNVGLGYGVLVGCVILYHDRFRVFQHVGP